MLGRMGREEMRAGDSDRQAVADRLKTALDEGRLDLGEYDERLQKTYSAKTFGDLTGLLDDLPGTAPLEHSQVQAYQAPAGPVSGAGGQSTARRVASWVGPYGGLVAVCTVIWAITSVSAGHLTYFWPVWMLIPLFFGLIGAMSGKHENSPRDRDRDARRAARRERRGR
ncbi:MAG: hypothetical protein QOC94_2859 [Actinoplanes sp.]|jgi:hypothetical protein|nr:hypothetical protein [Actinoplanes sp.]